MHEMYAYLILDTTRTHSSENKNHTLWTNMVKGLAVHNIALYPCTIELMKQ